VAEVEEQVQLPQEVLPLQVILARVEVMVVMEEMEVNRKQIVIVIILHNGMQVVVEEVALMVFLQDHLVKVVVRGVEMEVVVIVVVQLLHQMVL
jgi:hypothetical protein